MSSRMATCIFCKIIKGMYSDRQASVCCAEEDLGGVSLANRPYNQAHTDTLAGEIPSFKLFESDKTLAFMDIQPLSKGHAVCY